MKNSAEDSFKILLTFKGFSKLIKYVNSGFEKIGVLVNKLTNNVNGRASGIDQPLALYVLDDPERDSGKPWVAQSTVRVNADSVFGWWWCWSQGLWAQCYAALPDPCVEGGDTLCSCTAALGSIRWGAGRVYFWSRAPSGSTTSLVLRARAKTDGGILSHPGQFAIDWRQTYFSYIWPVISDQNILMLGWPGCRVL